MTMCKDLMISNGLILTDTNLKPNEKTLLLGLIQYHNHDWGYACPNYDDIKVFLTTKRNETVSNTLKSLVSKGYITIEKGKNNKNRYYILKHLVYKESKQENIRDIEQVVVESKNISVAATQKPVDSNGKAPLKNQIHIDEVLDPKVIEITEVTGFNNNQAQELLKDSEGDKKKVIISFEYAKKMKKSSNPQEIFAYTKWAVNNHKKVLECQSKTTSSKELKFNNFEPREYDYDKLERKLLGWDNGELSNNLSDYVTDNSSFDFETALKSI